MTDFEPKLIYLTRRHPSLDREAFTARWRAHGALGMSLPRWRNISRYVHCDLAEPVGPVSALLGDHDGIGMIWHRSPAHRIAHLADTSSRTSMETDEASTFATPIADVCLVAREEVVLPPARGGDWKLVRFLDSDDAAAATPADATGHVRNHALPPEKGERWGLDYALVEEFWFGDRQAAEDAAVTLGNGSLPVLGRDVQLYP